MTGFARCEGGYGDLNWTLELRSVNGRGLEIKYRFPAGFEMVERLGRDLAKTRFQRGQMNLNLIVNSSAGQGGIAINQQVLDTYVQASAQLIEAGYALTPGADGLLALRGVIEAAGEDRPALDEGSESALAGDMATLFERLLAARRGEGQALEAVLKAHLSAMAELVGRAQAQATEQVAVIHERFSRRLAELMSEGVTENFDERVLQEAALQAGKADVREELDRLVSHIAQAHQLIEAESAPGRKLDFLAQEFMREANTLCSKSAFIELTRTGLELKAVIDQFREQTQNVE
ncbi:YicC/YloC family endoribonuclease [Asticcacaulis sp. EMRT-3]|uniref:YicC/YloC family endoribonuclease n=1 Tax=Asticcacaulis sp. EMRT-3 TaxID=3040349 RepID=UPI0024AEB733|nr:YicC/YloC family endoribonuclease [Asticcacaulis sp. EMRT-3]MDI7774580.1 YicC/YloC family endoribonuclease [Asticcacaulis sp. EMRT-3]